MRLTGKQKRAITGSDGCHSYTCMWCGSGGEMGVSLLAITGRWKGPPWTTYQSVTINIICIITHLLI